MLLPPHVSMAVSMQKARPESQGLGLAAQASAYGTPRTGNTQPLQRNQSLFCCCPRHTGNGARRKTKKDWGKGCQASRRTSVYRCRGSGLPRLTADSLPKTSHAGRSRGHVPSEPRMPRALLAAAVQEQARSALSGCFVRHASPRCST